MLCFQIRWGIQKYVVHNAAMYNTFTRKRAKVPVTPEWARYATPANVTPVPTRPSKCNRWVMAHLLSHKQLTEIYGLIRGSWQLGLKQWAAAHPHFEEMAFYIQLVVNEWCAGDDLICTNDLQLCRSRATRTGVPTMLCGDLQPK